MNKGVLLENLETVLVVTVIAVLIWLFAEGETVEPLTKTVRVEFITPHKDLAVSVQGAAQGSAVQEVEVTFQVSQSNKRKIEQMIRDQTVKVEVQDPKDAGPEQTINLKDELSRSSLADLGAYIQKTEPQTVAVGVMTLQTVSLGIEAVLGELELSDHPPTFSPAQVRVTLPQRLADLARDRDLKLLARLDELDASQFQEDIQEVRKVRLSLPTELASPHAVFSPKSTEVTFVVRKLTKQITLEGVQVRLMISAEFAGKYPALIDPQQEFQRVTLKGPTEAIDRIDANHDLVVAFLLLKSSDLNEPGDHSAPLDILVRTTDRVQIVSPLPLQTMIDYTVPPLSPAQ